MHLTLLPTLHHFTKLLTLYTQNGIENTLTFSCVMLQNGQTYFKNLAVSAPQDF